MPSHVFLIISDKGKQIGNWKSSEMLSSCGMEKSLRTSNTRTIFYDRQGVANKSAISWLNNTFWTNEPDGTVDSTSRIEKDVYRVSAVT
jgi:hypothetical protein